jgi:hypothetical protein
MQRTDFIKAIINNPYTQSLHHYFKRIAIPQFLIVPGGYTAKAIAM